MKKIVLILLLLTSAIALNSCKCSETFGLDVNPDLKYISDIALDIIAQNTNNMDVKMAVNFINEADNECCEHTKKSNQQKIKTNVYYNATNPEPPNWGQAVIDSTKEKKDLNPCEDDNLSLNAQFLKDGYYLIEMILDYFDETKERSEENNDIRKSAPISVNPFKENEKFGNNRIYRVIKVTGIGTAYTGTPCVIQSIQ